MAASKPFSDVVGNLCVLDKSCKKHDTNLGDIAVVNSYSPGCDESVESVTLLIFSVEERDAAHKTSAWLKQHPDGVASEEETDKCMTFAVRSRMELRNMTGPMLRGVHNQYLADMLGRRSKDTARVPDEYLHEIQLARQLIGERFRATLAIENEGEQVIESHAVQVYAVEDHPNKVCFVYERNGEERRTIMRALIAFKHLPHKVHLIEAFFLQPRTVNILKKLPQSADAEGENVICCEEVKYLMDQMGFVTDKTTKGLMSDADWAAHMRRVGGQAANQLDQALSAYEALDSDIPMLPEEHYNVREMAEILAPIRVLVPKNIARTRSSTPLPPGATACQVDYPRAQAVKNAAKDAAAFRELLETILPWFTDPDRLAATLRHEATSMRALDLWLDASGDKAEPMIIASDLGTGQKTAEDLTVWALDIDSKNMERAPHRVAANGAASSGLPPPSTMAQVISHRIIQPDTSGTEGERRERNTLANHASQLNSNPVLEQLLEQLSGFAAQGEISKLFDTIHSPALQSSPLFPLLNTGEELSKAVAGSVSGETLLRLNTIRGALERRIENAYAALGVQLTLKVKTALRAMRMGKMKKVKIFNLLADVDDDKGTPDNPLQFLVDNKSKGESDALYVRALQAVGYVWVLCAPHDSANIHSFSAALSNFTTRQREHGASWQSLSKFHAALFGKVDEEAEKYVLNESNIFRSSPKVSWIEAPSRYLQELQESVSVAAAKRAADDAMKGLQKSLEAAGKASSSSKASEQTKKLKEQAEKTKKENSDLRKKLGALKKEKGSPAKAGGDEGEKKEGKRKREAKELLDKYGTDAQGRPPCYFHHRKGSNKCKFDADTCKAGHHLGNADDA